MIFTYICEKFRPLTFSEIASQFVTDMQHTRWYEYLAVLSGIVSVWYSKKENILVYPTGLVNTIIYVFISVQGHLLGEAAVNFYYTIMSIIGWYMWSKKDDKNRIILHITKNNGRDWALQIFVFASLYTVIFFSLTYFKENFFEGVIPWADALASATAFTAMWLMTRKKISSWYWWIATNITSIPLYFVKHYVFTSVYYAVLLVLAVAGLLSWIEKEKNQNKEKMFSLHPVPPDLLQ